MKLAAGIVMMFVAMIVGTALAFLFEKYFEIGLLLIYGPIFYHQYRKDRSTPRLLSKIIGKKHIQI